MQTQGIAIGLMVNMAFSQKRTRPALKGQHIINPTAAPWDIKVQMHQQRPERAAYHQPNGSALGHQPNGSAVGYKGADAPTTP